MAQKKKKSKISGPLLLILFVLWFVPNYPGAVAVVIFLAIIIYGFKALRPKKKTAPRTALPKTVHPPEYKEETDSLKSNYQTILMLHEKHRNEINQHFTATLQRGDKKELDNLTQLCEKDILLAPEVIDYYMQRDRMAETSHPSYPFDTFGRLSVLYERQGHYAKAIDICKQALRLGVRYDHIDESMTARIDRLHAKMKTEKTMEEA